MSVHGRTPRVVKAEVGSMTKTRIEMLVAGWLPVQRGGDPDIVKMFGVRFQPRDHWVQVQALELEAARTYIVGQWLTDSGGIGHKESWAAWLTDAFARGNVLHRYAVLRTLHRFMHCTQAHARGMVLHSPLYDMLPRFLELYADNLVEAVTRGCLVENVRALLQLRSDHAFKRSALDIACAWLEENPHGFLPVREYTSQLAAEHADSKAPCVPLTVYAVPVLYFFALRAPKDVGRAVFEGIVLCDVAIRPSYVRGTWGGGDGSKAPRKDTLFRFIHLLEYNSYVKPAERYQAPPPRGGKEKHHDPNDRNLWVARKTYEYDRRKRT